MGKDLGEEEEALAVALQEVIGVHDAVLHDAVGHLPVGAHLPEGPVQVVVALGHRHHLLGAAGPELGVDGGARLAHDRLPPQLVEAKDDLGVVMVGCFLAHVYRPAQPAS